MDTVFIPEPLAYNLTDHLVGIIAAMVIFVVVGILLLAFFGGGGGDNLGERFIHTSKLQKVIYIGSGAVVGLVLGILMSFPAHYNAQYQDAEQQFSDWLFFDQGVNSEDSAKVFAGTDESVMAFYKDDTVEIRSEVSGNIPDGDYKVTVVYRVPGDLDFKPLGDIVDVEQ